jgi:RNase P protein component
LIKDLGINVSKNAEDRNYFERTKRAATIETIQMSDFLCLKRDDFKNLLLNLMQKELDHKLKTLTTVFFLKKIEPFVLIPVATNIEVKKFFLGE